MLPFFVGLIAIKADASPWIRYTLLTGINGLPYTHSILVGWVSRNAKSVGRRAVSTAVYNMSYQVGSIIAANIYRDDDKPLCEWFNLLIETSNLSSIKLTMCVALTDYTANKALVVLCCVNIMLFVLAKIYYVLRNGAIKKRLTDTSDSENSQFAELGFAH